MQSNLILPKPMGNLSYFGTRFLPRYCTYVLSRFTTEANALLQMTRNKRYLFGVDAAEPCWLSIPSFYSCCHLLLPCVHLFSSSSAQHLLVSKLISQYSSLFIIYLSKYVNISTNQIMFFLNLIESLRLLWGSIILAADGSLSLKVKSCGSDHVITEAQNRRGVWISGARTHVRPT